MRVINGSGAYVTLSSLGAGIVDVVVPDKNGKLTNVALGYEDPASYMADGPCMGKTPGRYANRIAKGRFSLNGEEYELPVNNGPNHLHGGPEGFQNRLWDVRLVDNGVLFSLISEDGDSGYPGELKVEVEYRWSDDNELSISLRALADKPTVVNLTNHTYWNLCGADSGDALGQVLAIKASRWLPTDSTLIPTGVLASVEGTPMDFLSPKAVGKDIREKFDALEYGKGYDNCWALDLPQGGGILVDAVTLEDPESGIKLHVDTDQPGVQVYSGNWLDGSPANAAGRSYRDYEGVAIEAQGFPDAPNQSGFPSQEVSPEKPYFRTIVYRFTR